MEEMELKKILREDFDEIKESLSPAETYRVEGGLMVSSRWLDKLDGKKPGKPECVIILRSL